MLYWIQFRAVGWLLDQPYVLGEFQVVRSVPSGSIYQHDDQVFFEIIGDFLQEPVHHVSVCIGQDKRGNLTQGHTHSRIHVDECPDYLRRDFGSDPFGRPARSNIGDSSEAALVLSHDYHRPIVSRISLFHNLGYDFREFFLRPLEFSRLLRDEPAEARSPAIRFCEASDTRWSDGPGGPKTLRGPA